jgi:hypothetical protein
VLNEQFIPKTAPPENPIISLVVERINATKTLSENLIFMFNRAGMLVDFCDRENLLNLLVFFFPFAEDQSVQMLITKFLYLIFTVPGTRDWFYTNDLGIILDVILREAMGQEQASVGPVGCFFSGSSFA